jgi:HEAT repeat protein
MVEVARDLEAPTGPEGLQALIERLQDRDSRWAATEALLNAGPAGMEALREGLAHTDPTVRRFAARALDHLPLDDKTVEALVAMIRSETIPKVRSAAVHVLACEGCKPDGCSVSVDVVGVLINVLRSDPSAEVRRQTVGGLGAAAPEERVMAALHAALADKSEKIRMKAHWALHRQQVRVTRDRR